jgi:hypothetical protein
MLRIALLLSALLGTAVAAPAIVWQRDGAASAPEHHSDSVSAADLMQSALSGQDSSVVFFLGRNADGTEMLNGLASGGSLPRTQDKYRSAHAIHHHVDGLESAATVRRDAMAAAASSAATVSLSEFLSRMGDSPDNTDSRRTREVQSASVLIVDVPAVTSPAEIDGAIAMAIDSSSLSSVVLTAQRSTDEVKRERQNLANNRKTQQTLEDAPRRRLEDQENADDDANANNNKNYQGDSDTAYVHMTPNILAGILYTIMFIVVTNIGIGCMGSIQGQGDIYVKKMPTIGREA